MSKVSMSSATNLINDIEKHNKCDKMLPLIRYSQKFMIGDVGSLPSPKELSRKVNLPYPVVSIEYEAPTSGDDGAETTKSFLLCYEEIDCGCRKVVLVPFIFSRDIRKWFPVEIISSVNADDIADKEKFKLFRNPERVFPEGVCDRIVMHCVAVLQVFLAVLECNNVSANECTPPKALQKKRNKKKKEPFFLFHTLVLKNDKSSGKNGEQHCGHASPRIHFRRGHIRRLSSGVTTWVTACIVGNQKNGFVDKDYAIQR